MKKYIEGAYAILMTPFKNGVTDEDAFIKQVEYVNGTEISGFVVNGSTAEFVALSLNEQMQNSELVAKNKDSDKNLIVSACTTNLEDTLMLCNHAGEIGANGVLICPPYYFTHTDCEIKDYYLKIAEKSPVPVVLYNIPFFTQELKLDIIYDLFKEKNIIGIKDSSANMKRLMHLIDKTNGTPISILTGTDDILISALFAGCTGSFTAFATIFPNEVASLYDCFYKGQYDKAREIQSGFMPLLRKADSESFPLGYKKLMEEISGIKFGGKW